MSVQYLSILSIKCHITTALFAAALLPGLYLPNLNAQDKPDSQAPKTTSQTAVDSTSTEKLKSVSPGINANFLDPNLNVEEWLAKFEVESREIFDCRVDVMKALDLKAGTAVADIGAGTGLFMAPFAEAVGKEGRVYAVDISPRFVTHLRDRARESNFPQVEVVLCTDKSTELPPNCVDTVFICDTYHHFEFPQLTLGSIYQAVKPGGRLIIIDFNRIPGQSREWTLSHVRAGKEVFQKEVEDAGFKFLDEVKIDGFKENYLLRFTK